MATAGDTVKRSLRLLSVLEGGETPSAEEMADGITVLAQLFDTWSADGLFYVSQEVQKTLTLGKADYTIGPTGDIVTTQRPIDIYNFVIRDTSQSNTVDYRVEKITKDKYWAITVKDVASLPEAYFLEQTLPNLTIRLDATPNITTYDAVIYYLAPFAVVDETTDLVDLPPGYEEAVVYNLAARLGPEYGIQVRPEILIHADNTMQSIRKRYAQVPEMALQGGLRSIMGGSRYNIFSDGGN
jgi:hypothetical protein